MYWVTGILGLMFLGAPFVLGYSDNTAALFTSIGAGVVVLVMSGLEARKQDLEKWEYVVAAAVGLLAILSPFVFGFSNHITAMWSSVILGALVSLFAGAKIYAR